MWHYRDMPKMTLTETSRRLIRAVRAESGRRGVNAVQLAAALGRNPKYIYERFNMHKAFTTDDLNDIARCLGIDSDVIFESAKFEQLAEKVPA